MDIRLLQLFVHLSESLHFARTSRACNISPSALSRAVKRLEDEVGKPLFIRDNRTVQLTPSGVKFKGYAIRVLDNWEGFKESVSGENEVLTGEIKIYASVTACYSILPEVLRIFRNTYPEVHIKLTTGAAADALEKLLEGEADIIVAAKPDSLSGSLDFIEITKTPLVFIAPGFPCLVTEELEKKSVDWHKIPVIVPERGLARDRIERWFVDKGAHPNIYAEIAGNEALLGMVGLGCGIGIVPQLVLEKSPLKDSVSIFKASPELKPYSVGFCVKGNRKKHPVVQAFWDIAEEM